MTITPNTTDQRTKITDTTLAPTDAEIDAAYRKVWSTIPHAQRLSAFAHEIASTLAARWGAPAPASGDVRSAAQALVDRWDTPKWKDAEHTGAFIQRLREALAAQAAQEARVPLTEKQISKLWSDAHNDTSDRMAHQVLVRLVEAEHGITSATTLGGRLCIGYNRAERLFSAARAQAAQPEGGAK